MSEQNQIGTDGRSVWIGVALILSLAINTFFIGTYVGGRAFERTQESGWEEGAGLRGGPGRGPGHLPVPSELDPRQFVRLLPDDARDEARQILDDRGPEIRELLDASGAARYAAYDLLQQPEFDRPAIADAFAVSRAADQELIEEIHAMVVEIMAGLTPEQRAAVEEQMDDHLIDRSERRERFRRRHEGRRDGRREGRGDPFRDRDRRP